MMQEQKVLVVERERWKEWSERVVKHLEEAEKRKGGAANGKRGESGWQVRKM